MSFNLLALNVGNTRTQLGAFVDGKLEDFVSADNAAAGTDLALALQKLYGSIREHPNPGILMGSVNPKGADRLTTVLREHLQLSPLRVEDDVPIAVGRQLDPETIVGDDRLLNAAAAYDVLKQACVVVDAGTAITVDFIDGAGTFHGGAIGPGAQLMLDSLHQRTALLPEVQFAPPTEPIGHNTSQAMCSAVFHGLRGMVRELVEQYAEHAGTYPLVVATGGDAPRLFAEYELIDRVVPELTLLGLAATWRQFLTQED